MTIVTMIPVALIPAATWGSARWLTDHGYNRITVKPSWIAVPRLAEALVPWAWIAFLPVIFVLWDVFESRRRRMHARRRAVKNTAVCVLFALAVAGELIGMPWVRHLTHETLRLNWCPRCQ
jgi:hypothetical protein